MTKTQYDRWKDFAMRMVRTCYATSRRPTGKWIEGVAGDFFERFGDADTIACVVNWDHSDQYPESHGREYNTSYCGCEGARYENDGVPNPDCLECRGTGLHHARYQAPLVCDEMRSMLCDCYQPASPECRGCTEGDGEDCQCERIEELFHEQWSDQFEGPVHCCIRAGLDMACAASAGVIGFDVGDIRRMYPEGVPEWLFPPGERLQYWLSDELNGTFAELPDEAEIVL